MSTRGAFVVGSSAVIAGMAIVACGGTTSVDDGCAGASCGVGGYASDVGGGSQGGGGAGTTHPGGGASGSGGGSVGGAGAGGAPVCGDLSFTFTKTAIAVTAPAAAKWMHVKAWGAGGNGEGDCPGGVGGFSEGVFAVQPGQSFIVVVGGAGTAGSQFEYDFGFGNTGGGGLSGVFLGADALDENGWTRALVIAGGGGGDGVTHEGTCLTASPGNHPNSGGQSTMRGGVGLDDGVNGGGGGYRGGPGGAVHETGTGGSGFPEANAPDKPASLVASLLAHAEIGDTKPPRADDPDYDGHAGETETSGHVVVHFKCDEPSIGNGP